MTRDDLYHQLYESSPVPILTVDRQGRVVDCNRAACVRLARSRTELVGVPVLRWIAREDRSKSKTNFLEAFRGGEVEWRARFERGYGPRLAVTVRAVAARTHEAPDVLHVFLSDAAESRALPGEVRHLQLALESFPDQFVLFLDAEGCVRYSSGMQRIFGYSIEECLGREASFLFARGLGGRGLLQELRHETAAGSRWEGNPWMVRKDGTRFRAFLVGVPYLDSRGERTVGVLLVGRDRSDAGAPLDRAPQAAGSSGAPTSITSPANVGRSRSVLVVDDDEGLRSAVRAFLEKAGFVVREAWSGRSALARILSGDAPELMIADLKMKDGTGYWLLRELARDFPHLLRRTVILTGGPSRAFVEEIGAETGCPVIRKPFDFQVLLDRLEEVASRD